MESLHCPELGRPFGRTRSARGQNREPSFNLFRPISNQRANLNELWASPLEPPSSQRRYADAQLPRNFIFGQEGRHVHLSAPLAWRQPVPFRCRSRARDRLWNVRFSASISVLTDRMYRLTAMPWAVEPVEFWGRCFEPMTVCTTFLLFLQKRFTRSARSQLRAREPEWRLSSDPERNVSASAFCWDAPSELQRTGMVVRYSPGRHYAHSAKSPISGGPNKPALGAGRMISAPRNF
jgi:hypothetical protein